MVESKFPVFTGKENRACTHSVYQALLRVGEGLGTRLMPASLYTANNQHNAHVHVPGLQSCWVMREYSLRTPERQHLCRSASQSQPPPDYCRLH